MYYELSQSEIELAVDEILKTHHYNYNNFDDSKHTYCFGGEGSITYDAMSLYTYSHSLSAQSFASLNKILRNAYNDRFKAEDKKKRKEYEVLLLYFMRNKQKASCKIKHAIRPDFEIVFETGRRIGVEVTELTTELESVHTAIMRDNFGKGRTAEEIKKAAEKKHGKKSREFIYKTWDNVEVVGIQLPSMNYDDIIYAQIIANKFVKYREIKYNYDEFVVLCDGRHPVFISDERDTKHLVELAKSLYVECEGITTVIIRYGGSKEDGTCELDYDTYYL